MSAHRADLRAYVFAVARDLVKRGVIRRKQGQTVGDLIQAEASVVGREVLEDLIEVGREVGLTAAFTVAQAGSGMLRQSVDHAVGAIEQEVANWIMSVAGGRGRDK